LFSSRHELTIKQTHINHNGDQIGTTSDLITQDKGKGRAVEDVVLVMRPAPAKNVVNTRMAASSSVPASSSSAAASASQLRADTKPFRPAALSLEPNHMHDPHDDVFAISSPNGHEVVKTGSPSSASSGSFEPVMFEGPAWSFNEADGCTEYSRFIEFRGIYHAKIVYGKDEVIKSVS